MNTDQNLLTLKNCIGTTASYPLHSRTHTLKTFGDSQTSCFVKREDELGFGISGFKIRKYSSLIPHLLANKIKEAILIGGAYSNNIVGLTQLLIENSIQPTLFLHGDTQTKKIGNFLLTSLMVPNDSIHWVSRDEWPNVQEIAALYAKKRSKQTMIIPEGASVAESLPGALTLALDIVNNEVQLGKAFDHIFIDSGTGMMACATILAFAWLKKTTNFHVVLMAEEEREFLETLSDLKTQFESLIGAQMKWPFVKEKLKLYRPHVGRAFGSTNKTIFDEIRRIARTEGFLTDPVYSVKLFLESRRIITNEKIKGNCLIIHSGGGLTLMGFQDQLSQGV
ncbi:MAG: pyridoxal-phosphate dependent enzyme [Alphaproteobacteria bacterium]|nr:pyridoxal-phosphate dependent enzyme [Alphaproteobacteria bacterium]